MVQGVTPALKGLSPSRLICIFIQKDAHAGHTQNLNCIKTQFSQTVVLHYQKPLTNDKIL